MQIVLLCVTTSFSTLNNMLVSAETTNFWLRTPEHMFTKAAI